MSTEPTAPGETMLFPVLLRQLQELVDGSSTVVERERNELQWALIAGRWCDECIAAQQPEPEGIREQALEILDRLAQP